MKGSHYLLISVLYFFAALAFSFVSYSFFTQDNTRSGIMWLIVAALFLLSSSINYFLVRKKKKQG